MKSAKKNKLRLVKKEISFVEILGKPLTKEIEIKSMTLNGREYYVKSQGNEVKRTILTPDEIKCTVVMISIVMVCCIVI